MIHGQDVSFAGTAGEGSHSQVDDVRTAADGSQVTGNGATGGIVGVELDFFCADAEFVVQDLAGLFDGFINRGGRGGAGSIFECNAVKGDTAFDDFVQTVDIELRRMCIGFVQTGSQTHHSDGDLVFQTVGGDGFAGDFQVADVVQCVEVTDLSDTVFCKKFRMKVDDIGGLGGKTHHVDTAGKGLEVDIRTDDLAPFIHFFKSVFLRIEEKTLETGTAADFDVVDTGFCRSFQSGSKVFSFRTGSDARLEAVTEGAIHKFDLFHLVAFTFFCYVDFYSVFSDSFTAAVHFHCCDRCLSKNFIRRGKFFG